MSASFSWEGKRRYDSLLADERRVWRWNCEIPWERVPYLSALEVCSQRGAILIHVYLTYGAVSRRDGPFHLREPPSPGVRGWSAPALSSRIAALQLANILLQNSTHPNSENYVSWPPMLSLCVKSHHILLPFFLLLFEPCPRNVL